VAAQVVHLPEVSHCLQLSGHLVQLPPFKTYPERQPVHWVAEVQAEQPSAQFWQVTLANMPYLQVSHFEAFVAQAWQLVSAHLVQVPLLNW